MSNIEEDFRLFQLVRRKPIKNCIDLTKGLRGKTSGIFYFTEDFRIDFENKMCDLERLKTEREQDKKRIKELEEINTANRKVIVEQCDYIQNKSIPVQKVKDKIEELKEHYNTDNNIRIYTLKGSYELQVAVLQELLEDK